MGRKVIESGLCVKLDLREKAPTFGRDSSHTPYCVSGIDAEFLNEIGAEANEFRTGICGRCAGET